MPSSRSCVSDGSRNIKKMLEDEQLGEAKHDMFVNKLPKPTDKLVPLEEKEKRPPVEFKRKSIF